MKKIFAALLSLLVTLVPYAGMFAVPQTSVAFHNPFHTELAPERAPTSAPASTPAPASTNTQTTAPASTNSSAPRVASAEAVDSGEASGEAASTPESTADEVTCDTAGGGGGSLSQAFSGILGGNGDFSSAISGISGMLSQNGTVDPGAASTFQSALQLFNGDGSLESVSPIIMDLAGDNGGNIISSLTGSGSGSGSGLGSLTSLFGGSGGGSGEEAGISTLTSLFGGSDNGEGGLSSVTDLFSGEGGGDILGGAGDLLGGGGGGDVPVDSSAANDLLSAIQDLSDSILQRNTSILERETTIVQKECGADPASARLAQQVLQETSGAALDSINSGAGGEPQYVTNWQEYLSRAGLAGGQRLIDGPFLEAVPERYRGNVERTLTSEVSRSVNPPRGGVNCGEGFMGMITQALNLEQCSPSGAQLYGLSEFYSAVGESARSAELAASGGGFIPQIECPDGGGAETLADCPNYQVTTPASVLEDVTERAVATGDGINAQADEPGEVADQILGRLGTQVLQGIGNLFGTSRARPSGASGESSYTAQLAGRGNEPTFGRGPQQVQTNIANALAAEGGYRALVAGMATGFGTGASLFRELNVCYTEIATGPTTLTSITKAEAATRAENARKTAEEILAPKASARAEDLAASDSVIEELTFLLAEAEIAKTNDELTAVVDAFVALRDAGLLHTVAEIELAVEDGKVAANLITFITSDAQQQIQECRAFR